MNNRLSQQVVTMLREEVLVPAYDRKSVATGIVHLGVGAFHRAHQAVYVDACLADGQSGWGILGASLRSPETRDALAPQDGLYTLAIRDGGGETLQVVGAILSLLVAPESPAVLLDALTAVDTRIVTLTVTEKAYLRAADGGLDVSHPDVRHDLEQPGAPKTVHGFLVEAIRRRRDAGLPPFTILCCDNLPANGRTVRRVLLDFARLRDAALADYIEREVACPSSMIDRIVPATTDADRARIAGQLGVADAWPVMTEPFTQWVVEDQFPAGRPDWERFGVEMVADVTPYEDMKLRLLNGSHSAIAYIGLLLGHPTVDRSFGDPLVRRFVDGLWAEALTTLPPDAGLDTDAYTRRLTERYDNTALAHQTRQIACDGSQKLPQRILFSALERLDAGEGVSHLALVPAVWIVACAERGRGLPEAHFTDPLDSKLADILSQDLSPVETVAAVFDAAGFALGQANREALITIIADHLATLRDEGIVAALNRVG